MDDGHRRLSVGPLRCHGFVWCVAPVRPAVPVCYCMHQPLAPSPLVSYHTIPYHSMVQYMYIRHITVCRMEWLVLYDTIPYTITYIQYEGTLYLKPYSFTSLRQRKNNESDRIIGDVYNTMVLVQSFDAQNGVC